MDSTRKPGAGYGVSALVLGIVGMVAWYIPIFGVPINVLGLLLGHKGIKHVGQWMALTGIVLCVMGFGLSLSNVLYGAPPEWW